MLDSCLYQVVHKFISTQGNILFVAHHSVQLTGTNKSVIIMCDKPAPNTELLSEIAGNIDKLNVQCT